MSLTTTTPEKRKNRKDRKIEIELLEEESLRCYKWPENVETVEETEYHWSLETVTNTDIQVEMEKDTEDLETERQYGENEEKPNLKRRKISLDESIVDGEGSLKKLKIRSGSQDQEIDV